MQEKSTIEQNGKNSMMMKWNSAASVMAQRIICEMRSTITLCFKVHKATILSWTELTSQNLSWVSLSRLSNSFLNIDRENYMLKNIDKISLLHAAFYTWCLVLHDSDLLQVKEVGLCCRLWDLTGSAQKLVSWVRIKSYGGRVGWFDVDLYRTLG